MIMSMGCQGILTDGPYSERMIQTMLNNFLNLLSRRSRRSARIVIGPQNPIRVRPSQRPALTVGPATTIVSTTTAVTVIPPRRGVWEDKGWTCHQNGGQLLYTGRFEIRQRSNGRRHSFDGRVEMVRQEPIPFISNPPAAIKTHSKGPCFMLDHDRWYRIHWHRPPKNVDDAILYVEKILSEVLQ